jgi:YidC/Oxa1 family membrane protein insertase
MDTQRVVLFILFVFAVFSLWEGWQKEKHPQTAAQAPQVQAPQSATQAEPPKSQPPAASAPVPAPRASAKPPTAAAVEKGKLIRVETDLFFADITTVGGDLSRLELKEHRDTLDHQKNFVLLDTQGHNFYIAQAGLIGGALPNHRTEYRATIEQAVIAPDQNEVTVELVAPETQGIKVSKVYTFRRGSYVIDVAFKVANQTAAPTHADAYFQLVRDDKPPPGDSAMLPTYTGAAVYTEKEKFQKVTFSDVEKNKASYPRKADDGWIAILQHYFLSAWLPPAHMPREFYIQKLDNGLLSVGVILSMGTLAPGANASLAVPLYAGPQEQEKLSTLAPGLDLTVDYGMLTIIAAPLFWVLQWLYHLVGNWGTAIIIVTVIIKAIFYPLSAASYRSMAKMRVLAPKLQRLKEHYGHDRQKMNQAMMEIYKTEKINPLGGCLPIVIQIPVFIALYWVLLASVELRQAPFALWINDLSAPDPYYVLPVLMGATMIFQTYLNPEPPDPVQAKIMKIMPIAFSVFFFFFPAGLVLYWLVNNILSIAQQWQITRATEHAQPAARK